MSLAVFNTDDLLKYVSVLDFCSILEGLFAGKFYFEMRDVVAKFDFLSFLVASLLLHVFVGAISEVFRDVEELAYQTVLAIARRIWCRKNQSAELHN